MKDILNRLLSPTPKFFRVIRNIGLSISALALFAISLQSQGVAVPEMIMKVFNAYTITAGATTALIAQLTKIWTNQYGEALNDN